MSLELNLLTPIASRHGIVRDREIEDSVVGRVWASITEDALAANCADEQCGGGFGVVARRGALGVLLEAAATDLASGFKLLGFPHASLHYRRTVGGVLRIEMGASPGPAAFDQDQVDASASTTGIYFNMASGGDGGFVDEALAPGVRIRRHGAAGPGRIEAQLGEAFWVGRRRKLRGDFERAAA